MQNGQTSYDLVAYPRYTHPQTHPHRIGAIGSLFGLVPAPADHCRVLELGCGHGNNLVPMAWSLPNSEFVGIDLAAQPIAEGQQMVRDLGLTNVRLVHGDVVEIDDTWGKFDYIIAHGLFSWVPASVRDSVLALCRSALRPQGLAFISYNALPGGYLRNMLREMMRFHVRSIEAGPERVQQGLAFAQFLANAQDAHDGDSVWMKAELERIIKHEPGHVYHDELAEINEPFYFTQFMEHAARHGLQFLAEAEYSEMSDHMFPESVRRTLAGLGANRVLREQYLDFLKCRRFRQTLLCHHEVVLQNEAQPDGIKSFLISLSREHGAHRVDLSPGVKCRFKASKGASLETDLVLGKAALAELAATWPTPVPFDDLFERAKARMIQKGISLETHGASRETLCAFLLRLYAANITEFRTGAPVMVSHVSERPVASPGIRWQVRHSTVATSQFHVAVQIDDQIGRNLLLWLDGTHDRAALLEKIWQLLKSKDALVIPEGDEAAVRRKVEADLDSNLTKLAKMGLLVG